MLPYHNSPFPATSTGPLINWYSIPPLLLNYQRMVIYNKQQNIGVPFITFVTFFCWLDDIFFLLAPFVLVVIEWLSVVELSNNIIPRPFNKRNKHNYCTTGESDTVKLLASKSDIHSNDLAMMVVLVRQLVQLYPSKFEVVLVLLPSLQ